MDLGKGIQRSFEVYIKNFGLIFLAAVVAVAISSITFGILAGPVLGGLVMLLLKLNRGEKAEFNEIFAHFDQFLPTLVVLLLTAAAFIVLGIFNTIVGSIWLIGGLIAFVVNLALMPALYIVGILSLAFVVDKKTPPIESIKKAVGCFMTNPLMVWLFALIAGIIGALGMVLIIPLTAIGIMGGGFFGGFMAMLLTPACYALTAPMTLIGYVQAYEDLSTKEPGTLKIGQKTLQIAGITLGGLLVIGLLSSFVFHRAARFSLNPFSRFSFSTGGGRMDYNEDNDSFEINSDDGSLSFSTSAKLPDNFPKGVPVYPGAEVQNSMDLGEESTTNFATTDDMDEVYDYYDGEMTSRGWKIEQQFLGHSYSKDGVMVTVIGSSGEEGATFMLSTAKLDEE